MLNKILWKWFSAGSEVKKGQNISVCRFNLILLICTENNCSQGFTNE